MHSTACFDERYLAPHPCRYHAPPTGTSVAVSGAAAELRCGALLTGQVVAGKSPPGRRRLGLVPDALELVGDLVPEPLTTFIK